MKKQCKWFGHKYDPVELALFKIKNSALNRTELEARIKCQRCSKETIKKKGI